MPRILINEFNRTSPGTPGRYGNYAVLITGYMGTPSTKADAIIVEADSNGVYEFNSKQAFEDTIGLVEAKKTVAGKDEYHYGNRMAYHLLNLGYTVIYKVIDSIQDMNSDNFWSIFKDRASYDFRFVSHGLLETNHDATAYDLLTNRLTIIEDDVDEFKAFTETVENSDDYKDLDTVEAKAALLNAEYLAKYVTIAEGATAPEEVKEDGSKWFTDSEGLQYTTYATAKGYLAENIANEIPAIVAQQALIKAHDDSCVTSGVFNNINSFIAKLASYRTEEGTGTVLCGGRGDCTALIELDENTYYSTISTGRPEQLIINGITEMSSSIGQDGKYCAMTVPSVYYKGDIGKLPGAFHYLACFMNSLSSGFAEWYAAAGYTRGVTSYAIDHTSVKLGEIAINALEPRQKSVDGQFACNVIANFRGSYYLWGNRTAAPLTDADLTADHFLNIRQLCTTIKKQLYVACRRFTFDPNSDTLWFNFVNAITPTLDAMKADQGIRDYKVLKVFTDKKATLKAKIRIIPIEAVEDFDIEVSLEDSFGGVSVAAN